MTGLTGKRPIKFDRDLANRVNKEYENMPEQKVPDKKLETAAEYEISHYCGFPCDIYSNIINVEDRYVVLAADDRTFIDFYTYEIVKTFPFAVRSQIKKMNGKYIVPGCDNRTFYNFMTEQIEAEFKSGVQVFPTINEVEGNFVVLDRNNCRMFYDLETLKNVAGMGFDGPVCEIINKVVVGSDNINFKFNVVRADESPTNFYDVKSGSRILEFPVSVSPIINEVGGNYLARAVRNKKKFYNFSKVAVEFPEPVCELINGDVKGKYLVKAIASNNFYEIKPVMKK
jgi:uncharacterized protein (DUF1330 family)